MAASIDLTEAEKQQWLGVTASWLDRVDLVFEKTPKIIPGEHGFAAAELLVREQDELRRRVADIGCEFFSMVGMDAHSVPGLHWVKSFASTATLSKQFRTSRGVDGSGAIYSFSDLIVREAVDDLERETSKHTEDIEDPIEVGTYLLAKLFISFGPLRLGPHDDKNSFQLLISEGLSLVKIRDAVPKSILRIADDSELASRQDAFRQMQKELAKDIVQNRNQLEEMSANLVALSAQPQEIRTEIESYRNEAASALAAFREQIGLKETNQLWGRQARHGKFAYYGSLFVLLAIMCGVPILGWAYRMEALAYIAEIEKTIRENGDASAVFAAVSAASRLILVTAPLALAVWAIKLIVRFNLRSMLLMDDAEQRVTMLNTYLFLVDKGAATTADRGALLEAMFRRAPGHGADTIEPPNLTDIMKYGDAVKG